MSKKKKKKAEQLSLIDSFALKRYRKMSSDEIGEQLRFLGESMTGDDGELLLLAAGKLQSMGGVCPTCSRPLGDMNAPGMVGRDHPETSKASAVPSRGSQRWKILELLCASGRATAFELSEEIDMSRNQIATRLLELRRGGYVSKVSHDGVLFVRQTTGNHTAVVQEITEAGRQLLMSERARREKW